MLNSDSLQIQPPPIQYGNRNEKKARKLYIRTHKFQKGHVHAKVDVPGLVISDDIPYLACSADGVVRCPKCSTYLIEVKCLWKHRKNWPKLAACQAGICAEKENGQLELKKNHPYFSQIQTQMAVYGLSRCVLVIYTDKGICDIEVPFDSVWWEEAKSELDTFFRDYFYPLLHTVFATS